MISLDITKDELVQLYYAIQDSYNSTSELLRTYSDDVELAKDLPDIESAYDKLSEMVVIHSPLDI